MEETADTQVSRMLKVIEEDIIPLTLEGVTTGSKVFGAAILSRHTLLPLTVATNNERISPLLHGEINCIQEFFTVDYPDTKARPHPGKDCIFLATHEPCSLCLSGITWAGFNKIYFLFTYEDSRDLFSIPHDIDILEEVFRVRTEGETETKFRNRALYNRENKFFVAKSLTDVAEKIVDEEKRHKWLNEIKRVKAMYNALSERYQEGKTKEVESSSIWK